MQRGQMQVGAPPFTPVVKAIAIASVALFVVHMSLAQFAGVNLAGILGFVPARLASGWLWQLLTYSFLHASVFHLLFNLLVIWTVGSELETLWGKRTFLAFYVVCAVGAALTHGLFSLMGWGLGALAPVVGSSGVVYGLLLAYGILFGSRTMYFFLLFPMQARYFVLLLGGIELFSSVFSGGDGVAHLAHLGGMLAGFVFLSAMASWRARQRFAASAEGEMAERKKRLKKAGHLRIVKGENDEDPKTWN